MPLARTFLSWEVTQQQIPLDRACHILQWWTFLGKKPVASQCGTSSEQSKQRVY